MPGLVFTPGWVLDSHRPRLSSEIVGAAPYKGQRHMNMESLYEYGSRAGFWRLYRLFTERHMPCTVYACALALQRNPEAAAAMVGESQCVNARRLVLEVARVC